jgi:hypothetical protein
MITPLRLVFASLTFALIFEGVHSAHAGIISYTESFLASGSLGGQDFANRSVTLMALGDTSTIFRAGELATVDAVTSTVSVAGLGTAVFTDALTVFNISGTNFGGVFGLTDLNSANSGDILDVRASSFETYDLVSPIGPINGSFDDYMSLNNPSGTSAGDLIFTSVSDSVVVTASAVPEPSTLTMCGIAGAVGLAVTMDRRRDASLTWPRNKRHSTRWTSTPGPTSTPWG